MSGREGSNYRGRTAATVDCESGDQVPRIYIFDEATSALDSATELEIVRSLREISQSITTLVINPQAVNRLHADEIIVAGDRNGGRAGHALILAAGNTRYARVLDRTAIGCGVA